MAFTKQNSQQPASEGKADDEVIMSENLSYPFSFSINIDILQCTLLLVSLVTRMWRLDHPNGAVFDEVHFGRTAAMYIQRTFHFDIIPPLGKMLIAAAGHYAGFNGDFKAERIGAEFEADIPIWHLRFFPAFLGSLVTPLVYQIVVEMGSSRWTACLAATLIIVDNALLVQSRFMLMEGMLLFFISATLLSYLKFRHANKRERLSMSWWFWATTMSVCGTLALSIRYLGAFTMVLVLFLSFRDLWKMLPKSSFTDSLLVQHLLSHMVILGALPLALYASIFYVHLSVLVKAGPHDNVVTSAFQASLEGGLAAITRGQPLEVVYGSQITLRHTHGNLCWLHSHNLLYPIRYPDQRGSSHQQQVTCYQFKDVNNWWIVKDPSNSSLMVDEPKRPVRNGDVIQLIHGMTGRALNSHDVAAPISPQFQEVSGYIDHNISFPTQNLWRLEITNRESDSDIWKTIQSHIRLHHINTSQVLKISGKQLPDWGYHQLEVVTDRTVAQDATIWNVEEHRYSKNADEDNSKKDLEGAEMIPLQPTHMGFFAKFWELQMKMLVSSRDVELEHQYSSDPSEWPLLDTHIAYWVRPDDYAQIHLLGNVVIWYSCAICTAGYTILLCLYILRHRRQHFDISPDLWRKYQCIGELLLTGYLLHYIPYLILDRTLFLYLYLPALLYQIILTATFIEHIYHILRLSLLRVTFVLTVIGWLITVVYTFVTFLPLSYGSSAMTSQELDSLAWSSSWTFLKKLT